MEPEGAPDSANAAEVKVARERDSLVERARAQWRWRGGSRPEFAVPPGPGQESVWDYPRPPQIAPDGRRVVVTAAGRTIADSTRGVRILETASPPTFYLPPEDVALDLLEHVPGRSFCEWKGEAGYWALAGGSEPVAWSYERPYDAFAEVAGWLAFYPGRVECTVDGERVRPQPGGFYGGWITDELVGPFKGESGTGGW